MKGQSPRHSRSSDELIHSPIQTRPCGVPDHRRERSRHRNHRENGEPVRKIDKSDALRDTHPSENQELTSHTTGNRSPRPPRRIGKASAARAARVQTTSGVATKAAAWTSGAYLRIAEPRWTSPCRRGYGR